MPPSANQGYDPFAPLEYRYATFSSIPDGNGGFYQGKSVVDDARNNAELQANIARFNELVRAQRLRDPDNEYRMMMPITWEQVVNFRASKALARGR
ncbi:hypothetical protein FACS189483_11410 [Spirochaetia bacterium]|nr:hypothetical protein FACS189483_11410 [Spirochaetia bacterium]